MSRDLEKCVLVSYVNGENGDNSILIVGEQKKHGQINILNAIQGLEAAELFEKLTVPKGVQK